MRDDMDKVFNDRARSSGNLTSRNIRLRKQNIDENYEGSNKQSMRKPYVKFYGDFAKEESLNSRPIKRFLDKNIGKKWDEVWSEICDTGKGHSAYNFRDYIRYLVDTDIKWHDGELVTAHRMTVDMCDYYVHPDTNILHKGERHKKYRRPVAEQKVFNIGKQEYYKHNSIWYRVWFKDFKDDFRWLLSDEFGPVNGISGVMQSRSLINRYGSSRYVTKKEQANSKECKKLEELASED